MDVLILARVSHDATGIGRSVDEQVSDLTAWAGQQGWNVVKVIREQGSASRFSTRKTRTEWDDALEWIRSGRIGALLTWENSRATRDLGGYTELSAACAKHGVKWGYGRKIYDLASREDRFRTGLDALLSEDEAARTSERVRRAVTANAVAGRPHGKNVYGYRRVYHAETRQLLRVEPDAETAPIVREAARRVMDGESLYSVASDFNARGIPPRRPKITAHRKHEGWTGVAVKQMLTMLAYAGLRQHQGEIIGEAAWPPLIAPQEWHRLQAVISRPERRRTDPWTVTYLLTGIAQCGRPECTGRLVTGRNSSRVMVDGRPQLTHYRNYICAANLHTSIAMKYLDAIVTETVLQRLERPDFLVSQNRVDDVAGDERRALLEEISGHRAWLDQVRERATEERNLDLLFDQERRIQPKIDAAERQLKRLAHSSPSVAALASLEDIRTAWDRMTMPAKREIVRSLVEIRVHPALKRGARGIGQAIDRTEIVWLHEA